MDRGEKHADELCDELQELIWALVDDQATEEQVQRLEQMLLEDSEARDTYIKCMQLHADLHILFREENAELGQPIAPLIDSLPPTAAPTFPPAQNQ